MKEFAAATLIALIVVNLIESIERSPVANIPVSIKDVAEIGSGTKRMDNAISDFKYINQARVENMTTGIYSGINKNNADFPIQISN